MPIIKTPMVCAFIFAWTLLSNPVQAQQCQTYEFSNSELTVLDAYVAYCGRPADAAGLAFWAGELKRQNGNLDAIITAFGTSPEFESRFGSLSNRELVANIYQQLFNRAPDEAGLNFYVGELDQQRRSLQSIALDVLNGAQNSDLAILNNKRSVITDYYVTSNDLGVGLSDTALAESLAAVGMDDNQAASTCMSITQQLRDICSNADDCSEAESAQYQVVIVGAGVSGLKAASDLANAGMQVLVLEAQDRVGGRTRTNRSLEIPFDEGASWIHGGGNNNPIAQIAAAAGLESAVTDDDNVELYDADGNSIADTTQGTYYELFFSATEQVRAAGTVEQSFQSVYESFPFEQLNAQPELRDYMLSAYLEFDVGGDINTISSSQFDDDEAFGGPELLITNGYDKLSSYLLERGEFEVKLNQRVAQIDYAEDISRVTTQSGESYLANHVVVTVPLGVLKNQSIGFNPPLPESHQQAIERMHMGNVNKFLLIWENTDEPFWDINAHYIGYTGASKGLFNYFLNLRATVGPQANALMTFAFGDQADQTESMSDQEVVDAVMSNLRGIYGDDAIAPNQVLRTRWRANANSFGAYSFAGKGSPTSDFNILTEVVDQKLYFAGEHTNRAYRGTVHGAHLSGERVAEQIRSAR